MVGTSIAVPAKDDRRGSTATMALGKGLRSVLGQIVPAAADDPVRIFAREFLGIGNRVRMRRTIGITFKGYGGYRNDRAIRSPKSKIRFVECERQSTQSLVP